MSQLSDKIDKLFADEKWQEARAVIEKEMAKPGKESDHWLLTRLSTTYYEERQYKQALKLVERARLLAPNCPLVLWDYAGTLDALGRSEEAIAAYMSLVHRGPEKVGQDEGGEGEEWAIGLLTDCFYRVSVCLRHLERTEEGLRFFGWYAGLVAAGAPSMYAGVLRDVLRHVLALLRLHPSIKLPRSPRRGLKQFGKEAEQLLSAA